MAAKKQTAKAVNMLQYEAGAPANPTLLDFPADEYGLCVELRKAMVKLAGRLHGDPNKLHTVERNLSLLIGHMYSRYAEQGGKLSSATSTPAPAQQTYTAPNTESEAQAPVTEPAAESTEQTTEAK